MLAKMAFSIALVLASSQPLIADRAGMARCHQEDERADWLISQGQCAPYLQRPDAPQRMTLPPPSGGPGDVVNGRGPWLHGGELRQIAIYLAMGNHEAAAIAMSRLKKFGVTRDMLRNALDRVKLHTMRGQQTNFPVISQPTIVPFPEYPSRRGTGREHTSRPH
jgi:hypothetical protein